MEFQQLSFIDEAGECKPGEMNKDDYYSYDNFQYPNWLINAKYKSTLLHQRVLDMIIYNVPSGNYDKEGSLIVSVDAGTLKNYLQTKGNGWYTSLDRAAQNMTGQVIGYRNPDTKEFRYFPFISKAELAGGKFTVRFVPEVAPILTKLYRYTNMNLTVNRQFESVYAKILYAVLKSECYYPQSVPKERRTNKFYIRKSISELRVQLACVNPEMSAVRQVLNETGRTGYPDYDKAVKVAKEQSYKDFYSFKVNVLDAAVNQINSLFDYTKMQVKYEPIRGGRGGKAVEIGFYVTLFSEAQTISMKDELTDEQKEDVYDQITDLVDEKLRVSEIMEIAETADFQMDKIVAAYEIARTQKSQIKKMGRWLIKAISEEYKPNEPIGEQEPIKRRAQSKPNKFNNFSQRQYSKEELAELENSFY